LSWNLPDGYIERLEPTYHDDQVSDDDDVVHQPEAYDVVAYLLGATGRGTVIDIGCGSGRKLRNLAARRAVGVDYGPNIAFCRTNYPHAAEWIEADLSHPSARTIANEAGSDAIVICSDVVEHMPDPTQLLRLLEDCYRRGAIVITTTPDRARVRGTEHAGPPPNEAHVREWELNEYSSVIADTGLDLTFAGYTTNNSQARELKTILTLSDPDVSVRAVKRGASRPLAIIAAYNEQDIIGEVVADLLRQGCDVYLIDNWSTDGTWEIARRLAATNPARIMIERFPDTPMATYEWVPILNRKADIAARYPGRWIIHTDADEIRRSPFPDISLSDALDLVEQTGANRVDFRVINFQPIRSAGPGDERVESSLLWFSFGTRPGHLRQFKAWLQGKQRIDLASTGGHEAQFAGAVDFRYKFLLKHYPLRSEAHAIRKIEHERRARRSEFESNILGFHSHYKDVELGNFKFESEADLIEWNFSSFWRDYGLFVMTDLVKSRIDRGWLEPGK